MGVDVGDPEWEACFRSPDCSFEMLDAVSQVGDDWVRARLRHS
jgi:hypothetical protein